MLTESMRRNVLYITVSQHDSGIFEAVRNLKINREKDMPNLLVLSSGGNGHVPLPLLKQPEEPFPPTPMSSRRYFVSFIGSANMFNKGARKPMKAQTEKWAEKTKKEVLVHLGGLKNWREIMQNSTLTFVPRGFGRNSFRCTEVLQMGRVPIYVWNDIPWTFYPNLWDNEIIGFSAQVGKIEETLDHIAKDVSLEQLERMEEKILSMRDTHFTYEGVMDQISKFMTGRDGGSDLRCTVYPYSRSKKRPRLLRANRWWTSRTTFLLTGRLFDSFPKDFCCGAREHREAAVAHGALPKLLALLNAEGEVVSAAAAQTLRNIAADRSGALAIQHCGGIPALLHCAQIPGSPVAWRAASALANLAEWPELVPTLQEAGTVAILEKLGGQIPSNLSASQPASPKKVTAASPSCVDDGG
eukprot:symbB.v1.2.029133.t1/scaffold3148.1/size62448/2